MILECIVGSLVGTLLGLTGSFYIVRYQLKKDFEREQKQFEDLIEKLTTFKIKFEDVI